MILRLKPAKARHRLPSVFGCYRIEASNKMAADTKNVFVETEVFDHHWLDFSSPRLKRLVRLAAADELNLILTDVTLHELEAHIAETASESVKQIASFRKVNRVVRDVIGTDKLAELGSLTEKDVLSRLKGELRQFLDSSKATIVNVDNAKPSDVFKKYFRNQPPFNKAKKKAEFPDAFAASALEAWCKERPRKKLYIVSGDDDWQRLSAEIEDFIHVGRLDELLEKFADSEAVTYLKETINNENEDLLAALRREFDNGNVYFYVDDSVIDGEVEDTEDLDITIDEANVIEAKDGKATVGLLCSINVTLSVSGMDEDSMWRDPDDDSLHSVWTAHGSVQRDIEMEATVEVSYDPKSPHEIKIESATFQDKGIEISVEEGELETQYDERDEEEEPDWEPEDLSDDDETPPVEF